MSADFSIITELPGNRAHAEQLAMIHTRYKWAGDKAAGRDVLEAACGPGRGLGYLAARARSVVGGDITPALVEAANGHYRGAPKALVMDAQQMTFVDASFDMVLLFEALYYMPKPEAFLAEARRVLRPGGILLISCPNPEWADFNPSPFSVRYFTADELRAMLDGAGFQVVVRAGFSAASSGALVRTSSALRRVAVSLGVVPKSMSGKALLKRIFYGSLFELGPEIDATVAAGGLFSVGPGPVTDYKMLYADATRA